jgi:predicted DsbA family dithiol-disulfide isomerase
MKLEVFFDYGCPYCLKGHEILISLLPEFPELEPEWRPCEAHPRPERYGRHSDLLAMGMLFARDNGADLAAYHQRMYRSAILDRREIEDAETVAALAEGLLDTAALRAALAAGTYQAELTENNREAWAVHGFAAVPSLVLDGKELRSVENIGLNEAMMRDFFTAARK